MSYSNKPSEFIEQVTNEVLQPYAGNTFYLLTADQVNGILELVEDRLLGNIKENPKDMESILFDLKLLNSFSQYRKVRDHIETLANHVCG